MKQVSLFVIVLFLFNQSFSQFYYKDITVSRRTTENLQRLKTAGIHSVSINSFGGNDDPAQQISVKQEINNNYTKVTSNTNSPATGPSELISWYDNRGRIIKTVDSTDGSSSTTLYMYNADGRVGSITSTSVSAGQAREKEVHIWEYNQSGMPVKMLRIKNDHDTTVVQFVPDEKGNVGEENSIHGNTKLPSVYYYYDDKNNLTDIVRYNRHAKRLLPDLMFEYDGNSRIASMIVVPEGSDDYQRWVYHYGDDGLKIKETALNKRKQVLGRIEYTYR